MNRFHPYNRDRKRVINFDRHCNECGILIKNVAHQKPANCFKCKAVQEGRTGWDANGWGRCLDCYGFMNRSHSYCLCGYANSEEIERKKKQKEASRQQEAFRKEREAAAILERLREAERTNMRLQQQIDNREAEKWRRAQEELFFEDEMAGVELVDDYS